MERDRLTKMPSIIAGGMSPSKADSGVPWIQNMQLNKDSFEVRPGAGVICQWDSMLTAGKYPDDELKVADLGLEKHLGSHLITRTSFGHKQVVSVWRAKLVPSNMQRSDAAETATDGSQDELISKRKLYVVKIYDLTTDEMWEEVLHDHTAQEENLLFRRHGNYETSLAAPGSGNSDRQTWTDAGVNEGEFGQQFNNDAEEYFFFTELEGQDRSVRLFFGSARAGAWMYSPCDFKASDYQFRERWPQVGAEATCDWREPYSESPVCTPVRVRPGSFFDEGKGLTYVDQATFGKPQAACTLGNRIVWAVDNLLFFSDPEVPNAIITTNVQAFPSKIIGVAPTIGNLVVWTANASYYYNPTPGDIISGGTVTTMSSSTGILNPNAWVTVNGAVIWIDKNGIWKNYGNVTASKISDPLDIFFVESGMSNPLTNYYTQNGAGNPALQDQPIVFYNWTPDTWAGVNAAYNPTKRQIFFNIPVLNICLVLEEDMWHLWNFESVVSVFDPGGEFDPFPIVKGQRNMPFSWILTDFTKDVYLVAGKVEQDWIDQTNPGGLSPPPVSDQSQTVKSGFLCKFGRGGAVDRTLEYLKEDRRRVIGEYQKQYGTAEEPVEETTRKQPWTYFDKLRKIPTNYEFNWPNIFPPYTKVEPTDISPVWQPISFVPWENFLLPSPGFLNVTDIQIKFRFDNTHWEPYINPTPAPPGSGAEIIYNVPPERLGSLAAYNLNTANPGGLPPLGVYVTDAAGVPDPTGNTIWINIRGSAAPAGSWAGWPYFNFTPRFKNQLIELAFKRKAATITDNVYDLGISFLYAEYTIDPIFITYYTPAYVWKEHTPADNPSYQPENKKFQAVDWCYQGESIDGEDETVVKLRGIMTVLAGSNNGDALAGQNWSSWPVRLFNALFTTNYKQFSAQFVDHKTTNPTAIVKFLKTTLRDRVQPAALPADPAQILQPPIWGLTPDNQIVWASPGSQANIDNMEIGDAPQDEIRASADVKGERVAVQLFGHMMNPAEKLRIASAKAVVRLTGALRRKGRPTT